MFLPFDDLYTKSDAKHVSLDTLAPPNGDAMALEGLRELTVRRDHSCGRECFRLDTADTDYHIQWYVLLEKYLFQMLATTQPWLCSRLELGLF